MNSTKLTIDEHAEKQNVFFEQEKLLTVNFKLPNGNDIDFCEFCNFQSGSTNDYEMYFFFGLLVDKISSNYNKFHEVCPLRSNPSTKSDAYEVSPLRSLPPTKSAPYEVYPLPSVPPTKYACWEVQIQN